MKEITAWRSARVPPARIINEWILAMRTKRREDQKFTEQTMPTLPWICFFFFFAPPLGIIRGKKWNELLPNSWLFTHRCKAEALKNNTERVPWQRNITPMMQISWSNPMLILACGGREITWNLPGWSLRRPLEYPSGQLVEEIAKSVVRGGCWKAQQFSMWPTIHFFLLLLFWGGNARLELYLEVSILQWFEPF